MDLIPSDSDSDDSTNPPEEAKVDISEFQSLQKISFNEFNNHENDDDGSQSPYKRSRHRSRQRRHSKKRKSHSKTQHRSYSSSSRRSTSGSLRNHPSNLHHMDPQPQLFMGLPTAVGYQLFPCNLEIPPHLLPSGPSIGHINMNPALGSIHSVTNIPTPSMSSVSAMTFPTSTSNISASLTTAPNNVNQPIPINSESNFLRFYNHVIGKKLEEQDALSFTTDDIKVSSSEEDHRHYDSFASVVSNLNALTHKCTKYCDQTFIINVMKDGSTVCSEGLLSCHENIIKIILIERTSGTQGYAVGQLDCNPHFTVFTKDLFKFLCGLIKFKTSSTPVIFIPSTVSYMSDDKRVKVVNGDRKKVLLLSTIHSCFAQMFSKGLFNRFTVTDFGRGDVLKEDSSCSTKATLKDRTIPTISIGFGTQDCTRYSSSRMSIEGNIKPYLSNGGLSAEESKLLFELVNSVFKDDLGKDAFLVDDLSSEERTIRKLLHKEFAQVLAGEEIDDHRFFRIEGLTIIIGQRLAPHCDTQNSKIMSMNNAVAVTTNIPMNTLEGNSVISNGKFIDLKKTLCNRGYDMKGSFPVTSVFYSKAPIDSHVQTCVNLKKLSDRNDFNKVMIWALTERIGDEVDYRGSILEGSEDFENLFSSNTDKGEYHNVKKSWDLLNQPFLCTVAAYNKTGYWSIVFDFWFTLVANIIPKVRFIHVIQFSLYCGGVCNGTSLPWRLMEHVMSNPIKSRNKFETDCDGNLFHFLRQVDEEVADLQLQDFAQNKNGKMGIRRKRGSSEQQRYQFQRFSQNIDPTSSDEDSIISAINNAYFSTAKKRLQSPSKSSQESPKRKGNKANVESLDPYSYVIETLQTKNTGVGNLTAQFIANILGGCGGMPMRTYNDASLPKSWNANTGPVLFLKRALNLPDDLKKYLDLVKQKHPKIEDERTQEIVNLLKKEPSVYYSDLHDDLKNIFKGGQLSMNLLENTGCELWRCFKQTCESLNIGKNEYDGVTVTIIIDDSDRKESSKKDLYFQVGYRNKPQYLFSFEMGREGTSSTNPCLYVRDTDNKRSPMRRVTNWKVNDIHKNLVWWDKKTDRGKFTKSTNLMYNEKFRKMFEHEQITNLKGSASMKTTKSGRIVRDTNFYGKSSLEDKVFLDSELDDDDDDYVNSENTS